jgi:TatA/E family protein of Tat protein translocase
MPTMFGSLGVPEILFLMVLALLIFGPKRLPEIGRTLGRGLSEFRRASSELKRSFESEVAAIERDVTPEAARSSPSRFAGLSAPADAVERSAGAGAAQPAKPAESAEPIRPE